MSRVMLHGVLNMPAELWDSSNPFDSMQRQYTYFEASRLIYQQADSIAELKKRLSHAEAMGDKEQSVRDLEQQSQALSDAHKVIVEYKMFRCARDYIDFRALELLEMSQALKEQEL
jgi:hypothetical protein